MPKPQFIPRDISWLSFNERVLQEAKDITTPILQRIKFLGIFSNNLDEFFRVRISALKKFVQNPKINHTEYIGNPQNILENVNQIVLDQQFQFSKIWNNIVSEMNKKNIFIVTNDKLTNIQKKFITELYSNDIETLITPILLNNKTKLYCNDYALYLGISMQKNDEHPSFAMIEIPRNKIYPRFIKLPNSKPNRTEIILLEDIISYNLPFLFGFLGFKKFRSHTFKITKDADYDFDISNKKTNVADQIRIGIKSRRLGKPTRLVYDSQMDSLLVGFLIRKLRLSLKDALIPGGKIHNFKDFMNFPNVFNTTRNLPNNMVSNNHIDLNNNMQISKVLAKQDILLTFPYQSFRSVIDFLIEAAMDPCVKEINITIYRLASNSKIINALINAARNGKKVFVFLELRARFNEEDNLNWRDKLETEGITVLLGFPDKKIHAKICFIKRKINSKWQNYGFISTGNLNENTAKVYVDHLIMTSKKEIIKEFEYFFNYLKNPLHKLKIKLKSFKFLITCPTLLREKMLNLIDNEIVNFKNQKKAEITIKLNALNDIQLMSKLIHAAKCGVKINLIVRGIYAIIPQKEWLHNVTAISIVDNYLEHSRIISFHNQGNPLIYISSSDWMVRNLDHRIEATLKVSDTTIQNQILDFLNLQLKDNVKARFLDKNLSNQYVINNQPKMRSQEQIISLLKLNLK
ncbi:MAG: polyphosphate kinase 1 [Alphaproteobacteria bacterium]|nr:polyphosphate kinase 1 [Alphaproteobacteria bacterium]